VFFLNYHLAMLPSLWPAPAFQRLGKPDKEVFPNPKSYARDNIGAPSDGPANSIGIRARSWLLHGKEQAGKTVPDKIMSDGIYR
jgi:hypothetical protein